MLPDLFWKYRNTASGGLVSLKKECKWNLSTKQKLQSRSLLNRNDMNIVSSFFFLILLSSYQVIIQSFSSSSTAPWRLLTPFAIDSLTHQRRIVFCCCFAFTRHHTVFSVHQNINEFMHSTRISNWDSQWHRCAFRCFSFHSFSLRSATTWNMNAHTYQPKHHDGNPSAFDMRWL